MRWLGLLGGLALLSLVLIPLLAPGMGQWGGSDAKAMSELEESNPTYDPWFGSVWTPPTAEIETLLFTLQGAVGGLFIGYYLGSNT